jgi:hypothetical protein
MSWNKNSNYNNIHSATIKKKFTKLFSLLLKKCNEQFNNAVTVGPSKCCIANTPSTAQY